jgi:integrase
MRRRCCFDTGLRQGELLSLDWTQVRMEPVNGARFGFLTVLSDKAKSGKSRNVPLSARVVKVLKRWEPRRDGLVFQRADG